MQVKEIERKDLRGQMRGRDRNGDGIQEEREKEGRKGYDSKNKGSRRTKDRRI